ncbi:winged helix-turn-helix domain-containing protein [Acidisphaera sp. S103]|uniref:ATP-binding protein n=1 Tax=Acidisphaera sp. S103 TaxID=1747223 RepID=UPI00131B17E6|nr:winged helix-turn-helix domain-containing protein [Acidisphaera sp. S103]
MPDEHIRLVHASGECEIDLARRELRIFGATVPVGGRAFEVIEVLAHSAGEIVSKNELMDRIWPGAIVTDNTLHVHAMAVRKALGPYRNLLKTESGRGFRLLGDWTVSRHDAARPPAGLQRIRTDGESPSTNFPVPMTGLVGRSAAAARLRDLVSAYRLVTLAGPGGIGKTSLALKVARGVVGEFAGGGWLAELASLSDPALVPAAVAGALRLPAGPTDVTPETIARAVGDKTLLLVLDNCEHLIEAVAILAETLLARCPHVTILATSRETLRIQGEYVYHVPPLDVPAAGQDEADHILKHSAVELFITRTNALGGGFSPGAGELRNIGAICRHLDGIPLAIEFAAARASTSGILPVLANLHERFVLLTSGRRTALPRHRTLRAVLDWSYELLPAAEQSLLRHLAIFSGGFTVEAAAAVLNDGAGDPAFVIEAIGNLVSKSLVTLDRDAALRWHLLETTRVYGLEKLEGGGETEQAARRQAEFCLALFAPFGTAAQLPAALADLPRYRVEVDNLRAALNWAFSPGGNAALGVRLAATAADFWVAASLVPEGCERAGKALAQIGDAAGTRYEMALRCNLGTSLLYTRGMDDDARSALRRALTLALELGDSEYQQRAMHHLWVFSLRTSALDDALTLARQFKDVAGYGDAQSQALVDFRLGVTQIYQAEHAEAIACLQRTIDQYPIESRNRNMFRFTRDLPVVAAGQIAVSLLSQGFLDRALRSAMRVVAQAHALGFPAVVGVSPAWAGAYVFLSVGALEVADRYGEELMNDASIHDLRPSYATGYCVRGSVAVRRGDPAAGMDMLSRGLTEMRESRYQLYYPFFLTELAMALGALGHIDEGLAEVTLALGFAADTGNRWFVPETLRVEAELLALRDPGDPVVEDCLQRGIGVARAQGALFWELRLAVSLARLRVTQDRGGEARQVLAPVYDRFTEGFGAPDLRAAKALLDGLPG